MRDASAVADPQRSVHTEPNGSARATKVVAIWTSVATRWLVAHIQAVEDVERIGRIGQGARAGGASGGPVGPRDVSDVTSLLESSLLESAHA